jgi:hypothetical protein
MSTAAVTKEQIRAIHTLKSKAKIDEADYRAMLGTYGVSSSKDLTLDRAIGLIDRLKVISGEAQGRHEGGSKPHGALILSGPYAGICRALWISGWNLGVFEAREDTALVAFVRRQTGIDHLNWVRDHADGSKVVEALKAWIAREANVEWPPRAAAADPQARKLAVVAAQRRLLGDATPLRAGVDLDRLMSSLGGRVRALRKATT